MQHVRCRCRYGKVIFHAKLHTRCRAARGVECVPKRVEISTLALQGLYGELDRAALENTARAQVEAKRQKAADNAAERAKGLVDGMMHHPAVQKFAHEGGAADVERALREGIARNRLFISMSKKMADDDDEWSD